MPASITSSPVLGHVHTKSAQASVIGLISTSMYAVMVTAESVRDSDLMTMTVQPQTADETSTRTGPSSIGWTPGRMMSSAPANPTAIAVIRRARTLSPSNRIASTAENSGEVNASACTRATGVMLSA